MSHEVLSANELVQKFQELISNSIQLQHHPAHKDFHSGRLDAIQELWCYLDAEYRKSMGIPSMAAIPDFFGGHPDELQSDETEIETDTEEDSKDLEEYTVQVYNTIDVRASSKYEAEFQAVESARREDSWETLILE